MQLWGRPSFDGTVRMLLADRTKGVHSGDLAHVQSRDGVTMAGMPPQLYPLCVAASILGLVSRLPPPLVTAEVTAV